MFNLSWLPCQVLVSWYLCKDLTKSCKSLLINAISRSWQDLQDFSMFFHKNVPCSASVARMISRKLVTTFHTSSQFRKRRNAGSKIPDFCLFDIFQGNFHLIVLTRNISQKRLQRSLSLKNLPEILC